MVLDFIAPCKGSQRLGMPITDDGPARESKPARHAVSLDEG
jgi:hypothetical protein